MWESEESGRFRVKIEMVVALSGAERPNLLQVTVSGETCHAYLENGFVTPPGFWIATE